MMLFVCHSIKRRARVPHASRRPPSENCRRASELELSSSSSFAANAPRLRPLPSKRAPTTDTLSQSQSHTQTREFIFLCMRRSTVPPHLHDRRCRTHAEHLHAGAAGARHTAYTAHTQSGQLCLHRAVFTQNKRRG